MLVQKQNNLFTFNIFKMNISKIVTIFLFSAILAMPRATFAKSEHFLGFYDKYEGHDDFVALNLSSGIMRFFVGNDDEELKEFLKSVKHFKMLVYDGKPASVKQYNEDLHQNFLSGWYDDLLVIQDGTDHVEFKVRMNDRKINELVMVVNEPGSLAVFYVQGNIELSKIKGLSKSVSIKGLNHLSDLPSGNN
jgi:uncharacterized protein DUF4252